MHDCTDLLLTEQVFRIVVLGYKAGPLDGAQKSLFNDMTYWRVWRRVLPLQGKFWNVVAWLPSCGPAGAESMFYTS
jgi:hypothetical protein